MACSDDGLHCVEKEDDQDDQGREVKVARLVKVEEGQCDGETCPGGCCPEKCWYCCPEWYCAATLYDCAYAPGFFQ